MNVNISAFLEPLLSFSPFKTVIIHIYDVWICENNKIDFVEYNKKRHRWTFCSEQIMEGVKADTRWINDVYEQVKWNG